MRPDLVLLGAHAAGKSTAGESLARLARVPFDDEIGKRLAFDPAWALGREADERAADFDREVFAREIARDAMARGPRIVESWHPGNLAYAEVRNEALVAPLFAQARRSGRGRCAVAVYLLADDATRRRRATEAGDPAFFGRVARRSLHWCGRLGIPVVGTIDTSNACPITVARSVLELWEAQCAMFT